MSFFIKEPLSHVKPSIDARASMLASLQSGVGSIDWENNKFAWAKVFSQVEVIGNPGLRDKYILRGNAHTGEMFGSNGIYSTTSDNNVPMPGLTGITVENLGSMGATKKVTVKFVCWSKTQLQEIEPLYMTIGQQLFVEFGWNKKLDANKNISRLNTTHDFYKNPKPYMDVVKKNHEIEADSNGCHSIYQGIITTVNWTARTDGGFDCEVKLTSHGDNWINRGIMQSDRGYVSGTITTNSSSTKIEVDKDKKKTHPNIIAAFLVLLQGSVKTYSIQVGDSIAKHAYAIRWDANDGFFGAFQSETNIYISFYLLLKFINKFCGMGYTKDGKQIPLVEFEVDRKISISDYHQASCDPRVCLVPGRFYVRRFPGTSFEVPSLLIGLEKNLTSEIKKLGDEWVVNDTLQKNKVMDLRTMLVNVNMLYRIATENPEQTIQDFIGSILSRVSDACGGHWKFILDNEPDNWVQFNSDNVIKIRILEDRSLNDSDINEPIEFKSHSKYSMLRNVSLSTDITTKISNKVIAESTAKKYGTDNRSKVDMSYSFYNMKVKSLVHEKIEPIQNADAETDSAVESDNIDVLSTLTDSYSDWYSFVDNESCEALKVAMNNYLKYKEVYGNGVSTLKELELKFAERIESYNLNKSKLGISMLDRPLLLPLKLSFELDGFAGLRPGNLVTIDYIPDRYKNTQWYYGGFCVTNVIHEIKDNDWITKLETAFYYRPK